MDFIKDLNIDKVRNLAEDVFNQAKPKTEVEARVYEALSHKNWGASTSLMNEIAQDTLDYERFLVVTKLLWEAIENQRPAAWRVIFKGLTLLEHLVKNGSERCVDDARNHSHLLRTLDRFNYYEGTVDRGSGVREKAKQIVELLGDDDRIREERMKARQLRDKFAGRGGSAVSGSAGPSKYVGYGNSDAVWAAGRETGYAGRYGEGGIDSAPVVKTVVSLPKVAAAEKESKKVVSKPKKVKKKEKKEVPVEAAPVDLFSFDDGPIAAPVQVSNEAFDAFHVATVTNDHFGDFQQAPSTSANHFDAFAITPASSSQMNPITNSMENVFGNMTLSSQSMPTSAVPALNHSTGDEFGEFEDADPFATKLAVQANDPISKLISLDGLTKNPMKQDKLSEPVVVNEAAAQYLQDKKTNPLMTATTNNSLSFHGIDGLGHVPDLSAKGNPMGFGHSGSIMGSGAVDVGAKNISMMGPQVIGGQMVGQQSNQHQILGMATTNANVGMSQQQLYQMNMMRQQQMMNANAYQSGNFNVMGMSAPQGIGMGVGMQVGSNAMMGIPAMNTTGMMMQQQQAMGGMQSSFGQFGMNPMGNIMSGGSMPGMGQVNNMGNMNDTGNKINGHFGQFQ